MKLPWKPVLLGLVLVTISLPLFQKELPIVSEKPLNGFFRTEPLPELKFFTWNRWLESEFQDKITFQIEDHIGFRNTMVRLNNDVDFRFFRISHAEGFICGKNDNLFEEDYILEYTGRYFIGDTLWNTKLEKLVEVKKRLSELGTELILVLEPGKASFSPEYIPDKYLAQGVTLNNYTYVTEWLENNQVPYLDLNSWFIRLKENSPYPLFSKYGMHWSIYSVPLVIDTLSRFIEKSTGTKIPELTVQGIELSDSLRWTDKDISDLLNLAFPLPSPEMAYPVVIQDEKEVLPDLKVLVIADSYYVNISVEYSKTIFASEEFWYYNSKLYPHIADDQNPVYVDKGNLREKLPEFDVILLMVSEINLHCGFWNFADEAYQAFYPDHRDLPWYPHINSILTSRQWFRYVVSSTNDRNIPLEDMIIGHAKYSYYSKNH